MLAILSDIHGNGEALQAVLADTRRAGAEAIYCLGDVVGYGPDAVECLDAAMSWPLCLLGDLEEAALFDSEGVPPATRQSARGTRALFESGGPLAVARRREFLGRLPRQHVEGNLLFVHGSPRNPLHEYVFPEDVYNDRKISLIFALVRGYCFYGHTHLPGVIPESEKKFLRPEDFDFEYTLTDQKALINVGSVGQPRDGDWRACYVLFDGRRVIFRRVDYDIDAQVRRIREG